MRVIAAILADLHISPIQTRSRLAEPLAGVPVLRRTVLRTLAVEGLASVHVLVPEKDAARVNQMLEGTAAVVHAVDLSPAPHRQLVATARKWALDNWRGGIGGACAFDESFHAAALAALAQAVRADGVMVVPAHAPLLNSELASRMVEHFRQYGQDYRLTFAQSPPGLTPLIVTPSLLGELQQAGYPPGMLISYKPAGPEPDPAGKPCCYQVPTPVAAAWGRLITDTQESFACCEAVLAELGEDLAGDALAVSRFLAGWHRRRVPPLPAELAIELTTEDSLPGTILRPRGKAVPPRGPLDLARLREVLDPLAKRDDARVVFGGFGDPLCHPRWSEAIRLARQAGIFGVAVHTTGKRLAEVGPDLLLAEPPDLLVVRIDAAGEEVYRRVHGEGGYEQAAAAVLALEEGRLQRRQLLPLIVPAMTKARVNVQELETFFDFWIARTGSCWIEGYSDRAGQMERFQVASMAPPGRTACRRLRSRMMVLADGRAVACEQDFRGLAPVGDLSRQALQDVWLGEVMQSLRESSAGAQTGTAPVCGDRAGATGGGRHPLGLCSACDEWARP